MKIADGTNAIIITPGPRLFEFATFTQWVNKAETWFPRSGYRGEETICIDQRGRVCTLGRHFRQAEKDKAFPIVVYALREDETK